MYSEIGDNVKKSRFRILYIQLTLHHGAAELDNQPLVMIKHILSAESSLREDDKSTEQS